MLVAEVATITPWGEIAPKEAVLRAMKMMIKYRYQLNAMMLEIIQKLLRVMVKNSDDLKRKKNNSSLEILITHI